jgi:hypothetical protein
MEFVKKNHFFSFLEHQKNTIAYGNYFYSISGDLFDPDKHENLAGSIFALKLYFMLGETDPQKIQPIIDRILTFQKSNGTMYDPFVFRKGFLHNALGNLSRGSFRNLDNHEYVRAETRQAYSALLLFDAIPEQIYSDIPTSPDQIRTYIKQLDWTHPWGAGSHFSHLMFFLALIHRGKKIDTETFTCVQQTALEELESLHHTSDGAWYAGNPSLLQKINGAMKVMTGLLWTNFRLQNPEQLIDLCLSHNEPVHACDQINKILVLRFANETTGGTYRRDELTTWCEKTLEDWEAYYHPNEGGFSFWKGRANERYYGARITRGLNEPDIHGTVLFVWGLSMMAKLMPLPELNWLREMKS